jgi:carboxypeptidase Taq
MNNQYEKYKSSLQKSADIMYASAILQWDQETYMPPASANIRARQLATLAGYSHELSTNPELGKLLNELKNNTSLNDQQKANIRESQRDYANRTKYPAQFVEDMSLAISKAFNAWQNAKKQNDFKLFEKELEVIVDFKLREAELLGYKDHPYDALLDQYEPGLTVAQLQVLFADVRSQLVDFVKSITPFNVDSAFMSKHYDAQKQWDFGIKLLHDMGYNFNAGRQDKSAHPFTTSFSQEDVRVTTRINENDLHEMIWSTIHEGGHALYEQGLLVENYGLPMGEAVSLGIHESQSRLWENNVGRSLNYWKHYYPHLQNVFHDSLKGVELHQFYKSINEVKPSLIRTNADELTYHFHIMIRFGIEVMLMEKKVKVAELPELWNSLYKQYLGIDVPSVSKGVLQDVHWSHGSFGYFPTYSIGSFYAAQFFAAAQKQVPGLDSRIATGQHMPLREWLRTNIHVHGKQYSADELCRRITGESLNFKYFMEYAKAKYTAMK